MTIKVKGGMILDFTQSSEFLTNCGVSGGELQTERGRPGKEFRGLLMCKRGSMAESRSFGSNIPDEKGGIERELGIVLWEKKSMPVHVGGQTYVTVNRNFIQKSPASF